MLCAIIDERQVGKTDLAIDIFLKNPLETLFIVMSYSTSKVIIERIEKKLGHAMDPNAKLNIKPYNTELLKGKKAEVLLVDELYWKKDFKKFMKTAKLVAEEIFIIGSYKNPIKDAAYTKSVADVITSVKGFRSGEYLKSQVLKDFEKFYEENT
jgi:hypothetical protein